MQIEQLKPIIEAALLASSQPMTVHLLGDMFSDADEVTAENIARALEALANDCAGRGVELKEVASGFRYQVRQKVHPWISRMWTEKPSRYSRALLETLALIAYRQPITRPEIEQIRGVVVSTNIIKTMEEREWIRVVGYRDMPGKPALFGTTRAFLDYFNLKSLDQLPPLSEIRDMEDPQLRFEQDPLPPRVIRDLPIDPDGDELLLEHPDAPTTDGFEATDATDPAADADRGAAASSASVSESDGTPGQESSEADSTAADTGDIDELEQQSDAPDDSAKVGHRDENALEPSTPSTADEAANPADVEPDDAKQDTEEYRA